MPRYKLAVMGADSNDLGVYEELAASAADRGFNAMYLGALAETTLEQEQTDPRDAWLRFSAGCPALMKVVETSLVHGVLSEAHIEGNARLVAAKSQILAKYGLWGVTNILEPMWLPEWFYEQHPEVRGARCDNPCLAREPYYSPCLDNEAVLDHYREGVRSLLRLAPRIRVLTIGTNDSGAGICWGTGLYPGPNGPDHCSDVPMGTRLQKWFKAMLAGAKDAGGTLEVAFHTVHFSRAETRDTIDKLPRHATVLGGKDNFPDKPRALREKKRLVIAGVNPTLVPWCLSPVIETPFPYHNLEAMQRLAESRADIVMVGGFGPAVYGMDTVATTAILSGFKKPPKSSHEIEKRVFKIAREQVGARLAPSLVSAWREVDRALRTWILGSKGDTNHLLHPQYSFKGSRWVTRPIVPDPKLIPEEQKTYFRGHPREKMDSELRDNFFLTEGTINYQIDEMKWPVVVYDEIMGHMNRAKELLDAAQPLVEKEDEPVRKRWNLLRDRVLALRAVWRTQRNVLRAQSIIEFFTGEKKDRYWNVIRKDESFFEPPTYRRFFLEAVDDEIENCREMIRLMRESEVELIETGDIETTYTLPRNLPDVIEKKIALMEAHKGDIDVLFPDCPEERFADPNYDWADVNKEKDRAIREKDTERMKGR